MLFANRSGMLMVGPFEFGALSLWPAATPPKDQPLNIKQHLAEKLSRYRLTAPVRKTVNLEGKRYVDVAPSE